MKKNQRKGIAAIIFLIAAALFCAYIISPKISPAHTKNIAVKPINTGKETAETTVVKISDVGDEPLSQAAEEESLLTITQTAADCQFETYIYVDMDHDGLEELIGVCRDNADLYQTWYCSSDGTTCLPVHQNDEGMDACAIELLEFDEETHVVINAYRMMGTGKNYTIIALWDDTVSCLLSNKYGYVCMTENGDITLDVEAYDAMYDPELGMTIGHTWNDTYLYFDGETYKEYGATKIEEAEYLSYENAQTIKDRITAELTEPDTVKLEFSYFTRKNNLMHIQCDAYNHFGTIQYGYYTISFLDGILMEPLGEYTSGQMAPSFSDLEVTY